MHLFRRQFAYGFLVAYILAASSLIYLCITLQGRKTSGKELPAAFARFGGENKSQKFPAKDLSTLKQFIFLTQTEQCIPSNLAESIGDAKSCNCDIIVLSYKEKCNNSMTPPHLSYLFDPRTSWTSGRNILYFTALNRTVDYFYYIFLDDDATFGFNEFTPFEMKKTQPLRAVQEWLLDYEPVVGVLDYKPHHGAKWTLERRKQLCGLHNSPLVLPVVWFDAIFHAFHHKAIGHILPYSMKYEEVSWTHSALHVIAVLELKFRGQALLYAAVTVANHQHRNYPRSGKDWDAHWRSFVEEIQHNTPIPYRDHNIFEEFKKAPSKYTETSSTHCLNVTRKLPAVPFAHFDRQ